MDYWLLASSFKDRGKNYAPVRVSDNPDDFTEKCAELDAELRWWKVVDSDGNVVADRPCRIERCVDALVDNITMPGTGL